jgi:acetamidase/formamidase
MHLHNIRPERKTLHGHFSRDLAPVLTIDSGDTIRFKTLDAFWNLEPHRSPGEVAKAFEPRVKGLDDGHALCGPVAVKGARPGRTLEVEILKLEPANWGWSFAGGIATQLNRRLRISSERRHWMLWRIDTASMTATNQDGHTLGLHPFLGVMGMPPNEPGIHPTRPPRFCGGNLDCKELVQGTKLYLPISVPGALFSTGDGHACQGDGEVSGTGIECPMEVAELRLTVRDDILISNPQAETPAGWLTLGFGEHLDEAMLNALEAMVDVIAQRHDLGRPEALALASLTVDLRVTQVVNGVCGVHAVLPNQAIT